MDHLNIENIRAIFIDINLIFNKLSSLSIKNILNEKNFSRHTTPL